MSFSKISSTGAGGGGGDATAVLAAAVIADNTIVRGDGGVRGVQDSGVTIDDSDNVTTPGVLTGLTVEATGDTAAGDNSALGYTVAEGAILTGQGTTSDVTIKNDVDAVVLSVPTGTNTVQLGVDGTVSSLNLTEKASIALDPAGGADGDYSGITITGTAGATVAFGETVYLAVGDSRWELTDADAVATAGGVMVGICVLAAAADASPITVLLQGVIRADAAFPALTIGAAVYLGLTPGAVQVAAPSATDDVVRVAGFALTADEIYFNPSQDHLTVV